MNRRFSMISSIMISSIKCKKGVLYAKKGMFYTIVALLILVIIAGVFFTQSRRDSQESHQAVLQRVMSMNDFIKSLDDDSRRASYISGFRSLIALEQHVLNTGEPIDDMDVAFRAVFVNGTYENATYAIMDKSTFNDYLSRVSERAASQGIVLNMTVSDVVLWQADPWNVKINYTLDINATDRKGTASWQTTKTFTGTVPITDLRDPLFTSKTYGRIQRVIKPTNTTIYVDDASNKNDTTGLMTNYNLSYYSALGRGPSIIMRFEGNITGDSIYGIESLVDTEELEDQSLDVLYSGTVVDYLYFSNVPATICSIQNVPSKIKFDADSAQRYGVTGALDYAPC